MKIFYVEKYLIIWFYLKCLVWVNSNNPDSQTPVHAVIWLRVQHYFWFIYPHFVKFCDNLFNCKLYFYDCIHDICISVKQNKTKTKQILRTYKKNTFKRVLCIQGKYAINFYLMVTQCDIPHVSINENNCS